MRGSLVAGVRTATSARLRMLGLAMFAAAMLLCTAHANADVFGRPDTPFQHSAPPPHPLPLPGFARDAIRMVIVAQARLDEALQDDVMDLRSLGADAPAAANTAGRHGAWLKLFFFIGLCVAYGVLHALAPGHGKTVAASWFGSRAATARQVLTFTFATALGQSLTAILLVSAALALFEGTVNTIMRDAAPLELVSAIAIFGVAALTAVRILRRDECCAPMPGFAVAAASNEATGDTERSTYLGTRLTAQQRTKQAFNLVQPHRASWLAFAVALRPCAGALFILLISARYHAYWLGVTAAAAIGFGVALTVFAVGYVLRGSRAAALRFTSGARLAQWQRGVALAGAIVIAAFSALQILLIATGVTTMMPG